MKLNKDYEEQELARIRKLMQDPLYWKKQDPAIVAQVRKGFADLYDNPPPEALAMEGQMANQMGINGQYHGQDTEIAHVTPGEIVIPQSAQTPELMQHLSQILGGDLLKYTVGSGYEQQNPTSGLPAFAGPKDDQTYCDDAWDRVEAKQKDIDEMNERITNESDPIRKAALQIILGRLENDLRSLQGDLAPCFNY